MCKKYMQIIRIGGNGIPATLCNGNECLEKLDNIELESLIDMLPWIPICILRDSLYACGTVFDICKKNKWEFLILFKGRKYTKLSRRI